MQGYKLLQFAFAMRCDYIRYVNKAPSVGISYLKLKRHLLINVSF